jgi:putative flippase GtrA
VDVVATALDDLRGVWRLRRALASDRLPVAELAARIGRHGPGTGTCRQLRRFAAVGVLSTAVHLGLFAALTVPTGSRQTANLVGLLIATTVNTALNRRWTFGLRGTGRARHQLQGLLVFAVTWLMTAGALDALHGTVANPSTAMATTVVAVATALTTVLRFVAMRTWMFRVPQSSLMTNVPASSSNTTIPVQSKPSTEPLQTVTNP